MNPLSNLLRHQSFVRNFIELLQRNETFLKTSFEASEWPQKVCVSLGERNSKRYSLLEAFGGTEAQNQQLRPQKTDSLSTMEFHVSHVELAARELTKGFAVHYLVLGTLESQFPNFLYSPNWNGHGDYNANNFLKNWEGNKIYDKLSWMSPKILLLDVKDLIATKIFLLTELQIRQVNESSN